MLLKSADDKSGVVSELEALLKQAGAGQRDKLEQALRWMRAGIKGEEEAAYHVNFDYERSDWHAVLHDLRFEVGGRVAQIDHLLITRTLNCFVLETKSFHAGVKITEEGEFLRWNDFAKRYEGMASPLAQNERHISVLKEVFASLKLPTFMGQAVMPLFHSYVLVSAHARIDRPKRFDTSRVIKMDALKAAIQKQMDQEGVLSTLMRATRLVDQGTLLSLGRQLMAQHRPSQVDWGKRYGLNTGPLPAAGVHMPSPQAPARNEGIGAPAPPPSAVPHDPPLAPAQAPQKLPQATPPTATEPSAQAQVPRLRCPKCQEGSGSILYGKYGYYLKCEACGGNSNVKGDCPQAGHKARVRKEGASFFQECEACGSSVLMHRNAEG